LTVRSGTEPKRITELGIGAHVRFVEAIGYEDMPGLPSVCITSRKLPRAGHARPYPTVLKKA